MSDNITNETMADELLHGMLMRDLFAALGWDRHGRSFNDAMVRVREMVARETATTPRQWAVANALRLWIAAGDDRVGSMGDEEFIAHVSALADAPASAPPLPDGWTWHQGSLQGPDDMQIRLMRNGRGVTVWLGGHGQFVPREVLAVLQHHIARQDGAT